MSEPTKEISLSNIQDVVRDRVRAVLIDSMPKEAIENLMKKEFADFFEPQIINNYNNEKRDSRFKQMIQEEIKAQLKPMLIEGVRQALNEDNNQYAGPPRA